MLLEYQILLVEYLQVEKDLLMLIKFNMLPLHQTGNAVDFGNWVEQDYRAGLVRKQEDICWWIFLAQTILT